MASWLAKRKMYVTAYLIYTDAAGAQAQPCGEIMVQSGKGGDGKTFFNWALDVRSCAPSQRALLALDGYYTPGGSGYARVPNHLRPILRAFWKNMRERRLIRQGERVVNTLYEDGYEFC